ncbi:1-acyl-sn-glycerol-3-phosphate acyltransferase [Bacillus luteolus]|uniref:1-acyl-sn-glycerol-3-phosphate acyltransferase n=1 Tax=Litchfieldia luteola TaxID=682179 RepID=A0ABR9QP71_9BACI|nr:lysophospholipid acyltransferase family protein [Cytobacillus luteolus]MBE4910305.1 1-acyl-sn-glycerol-3-phosphate acyltransferase [Cytobacillus luteolus]MBP1942121.1 1-acyl-sn-glycerol-3-phosphate acyltransferase [Cytobacillus luteolus]
MNLYTFAKGLTSLVFNPLYRVKVVGAENIPTSGSVLICSNHINNFDPIIVGISAPRPIHFMAKEELFRVPLLGQLVPKLNAFPVKRGMSDREALRKGLKVLKDDNVLGLFPEGTRSKDGKLGKGLAGAGFFATRSEAAVVPCAIIGPYKLFGQLKVVFGEPIDMNRLREQKASAEETTEVIMNSIKELLEKY